MRRMQRLGVVSIVLYLVPAFAAKEPVVSLEVTDLTPKFIAFYDAASKPGVDEKQRWALWQKMYGFAAVPPTAEGQKMARTMLDEAWPKYAGVLATIRQGIAAIHPAPEPTLKQVAALLQADVPIRARLVVAVGDFEGNTFTAPGKDGVPTVAVEVEDPEAGLKLNHEFTHVVEAEQAGLSLSWQRSIAQTVFAEGLAMHVVKTLHPELSDAEAMGETSPGWLSRCAAQRSEILADIAPHLEASDSDTVMRYTMGEGGAGLEREAYYAGWLVIADLQKHGWTYARLARVKDGEMVGLVRESLRRLRAG